MIELPFFIENIILIGLSLILYHFLCRNGGMFRLNRSLLWIILLSSLILPLIDIPLIPVEAPKVISNSNDAVVGIELSVNKGHTEWNLIMTGYLLVAGFLLIRMIHGLYQVYKLVQQTKFGRNEAGYLVSKCYDAQPFSFFNYLFLPNNRPDFVYQHEKCHADNYHSIDIMFYNVFRALLWFNPFIYWFGRLIRENHELHADAVALYANKVSKDIYINFLKKYHTQKRVSLINTFDSLLVQRIKYLYKTKKSNIMHYSIFIMLLLIISSAFSIDEYEAYNCLECANAIDTLPRQIEIVDTISIDENSSQLVKKKVSLEEYIDDIKLSGKTMNIIDTIIYFEYDTYSEKAEEHRATLPIELVHLYRNVNMNTNERIYFAKQFGEIKVKLLYTNKHEKKNK